MVEAVDEASITALDDPGFDGCDMGYTLLSLLAPLISCWQGENFEQELCQVIEAGGDIDTSGAIAGAVPGARFGLEGIPDTTFLDGTIHTSPRSREQRVTRGTCGSTDPVRVQSVPAAELSQDTEALVC